MSRPRSRTRREFPQTSRGSSLLESSLRMEEPSLTTTSRRRALSILCSDLEEETKFVAHFSPNDWHLFSACFCTD